MVKDSLYFMCVCLSFNIEGGQKVIVPTVYAKLFGHGNGIRVFSVGFMFTGIASLINIGIMDNFLDSFHFHGICYLYAAFGSIALILLFNFKE